MHILSVENNKFKVIVKLFLFFFFCIFLVRFFIIFVCGLSCKNDQVIYYAFN